MTEQPTEKPKRRAISKKLRFEVFKRDSFTCQYCGKKAPDVVLEIEHINPVSKGGTNSVLNLLTSCEACNAGKGDRTLSDAAALSKAHEQAHRLQERRAQIKMMADWNISLVNSETDEVEAFCDVWYAINRKQYKVSEQGKSAIRKLLQSFSLSEICEAAREAAANYFKPDGDSGFFIDNSVFEAFSKISGICRIKSVEKDEPMLGKFFYIRGILRNRFPQDRNEIQSEAMWRCKQAYALGWSANDLYRIAVNCHSWGSFHYKTCFEPT